MCISGNPELKHTCVSNNSFQKHVYTEIIVLEMRLTSPGGCNVDTRLEASIVFLISTQSTLYSVITILLYNVNHYNICVLTIYCYLYYEFATPELFEFKQLHI